MDGRRLITEIERERQRQGMTKARLADKAGLQRSAVRKLLSNGLKDVRLSTLEKLTIALGARIAIELVDHGLDDNLSHHVMNRVKRRNDAEKIALRHGHDPGDVEHALRCLDMTPSERLSKALS